MKENELINLVPRGDRKAFESLFNKYKDYSYKISFSILRNEHDSLDNINDSWIKIYKALTENKFDRKSRFSTWIYRIIINEALHLLRKKKLEVLIDSDILNSMYSIESDNMDEILDDGFRFEKVMKTLNLKQQKIINMLIEGYKFEEIAKELSIKPNHLYQITSRIKKLVNKK